MFSAGPCSFSFRGQRPQAEIVPRALASDGPPINAAPGAFSSTFAHVPRSMQLLFQRLVWLFRGLKFSVTGAKNLIPDFSNLFEIYPYP